MSTSVGRPLLMVRTVGPSGESVTVDVAGLVAAAEGLQVGGHRESGEGDPMTAAEFRMVRMGLGLTQDEFGQVLGLWSQSSTASQRSNAQRRVRRYEAGTSFVPDKVRVQIEELEMLFHAVVGELVGRLNGAADVVLTVPRVDGIFPAGWWLSVAREAAIQVPGLTVRYPDQDARADD